MTEAQSAYDPAAAWARIAAQYAERRRLAAQVLPANKAALFDALAAAGVTSVVVSFDGSGDEGQIEDIDPRVGETSVTLPNVHIEIATPSGDGSAASPRSLRVTEAIEDLAYAFLQEAHDGWENSEGAFGEFTFDVAERTIELDYNERFETSEYYAHSW